jgi:hypothetical protein
MSRSLSGSDVLGLIERMLGDTHDALENFDARLQRSTAELDRVRQAELGALSVLARVRLREIESGELIDELDDTGRQVTELLGQRGTAQEKVGTEITASREVLEKIEAERAAQHAVVEKAEKVLDAAQADAQQYLKADAAYGALLEKTRASDAIADVTQSKAQSAHTDRTEKGKPYEQDPLFRYLWERGYGTAHYRAGAMTRLFDRWVARVEDFEPLRRNYWMLTELPARFDEHAKHMRALADDDMAALRAAEQAAAAAAGVPERQAALKEAEDALAAVDKRIEAQEAEVAALVEKRAAFAAGEDDLSQACYKLLTDALRGEKMRTLRERASRTPSPDDDAAVDQLTEIRAEKPRLEDEVARYRTLHDQHRERAARLEEVRKRFKEQRYDAASSEFVNGALVATLLSQLLSGSLGTRDMWDALKKQQRHRALGADPVFGSGRFPRGRGPGPWLGGGGGGGGWPRGGGFGGGGFGTGGGFGGGGFKTGGGF